MIFDDIVLKWGGVEYTIKSDEVMGAIARVEEIVTLQELASYVQTGKTPMSKLAMAFGSVLRYAGATVKDQEVYAGMFEQDGQNNAVMSLSTLLSMMIPQTVSKKSGNEQAEPTVGNNS
jgi:hypothetical protein